MCWNVQKIIRKLYTEILFHCSNLNIDSPLSSIRVILEK